MYNGNLYKKINDHLLNISGQTFKYNLFLWYFHGIYIICLSPIVGLFAIIGYFIFPILFGIHACCYPIDLIENPNTFV